MTPPEPTCQQLADLFAWQVQIGNGANTVRPDRRGLDGLRSIKIPLRFYLPEPDEMYADNGKTVLLRINI